MYVHMHFENCILKVDSNRYLLSADTLYNCHTEARSPEVNLDLCAWQGPTYLSRHCGLQGRITKKRELATEPG